MSYPEDVRALKRTKMEAKADWLVWRKGKFSSSEIDAIKSGLESWVGETSEETSMSREEALESLKWAKDHKMTAWCDIATRCSLPHRKIGAIRHCILRRLLPGADKRKWTEAESAEFVRLQEAYGPRAWKQIAQETGRTLEGVVNKGRALMQAAARESRPTKFSRQDTLRVKLSKLIKDGLLANPYETSAIKHDCELVALVRKYTCPDGQFECLNEIPSSKLGKKLKATPFALRVRWHNHILPEVIRQAHSKLGDREAMDAFLVFRLRKACRGELEDQDGHNIFPCNDWSGIDWKNLMPMWPQGFSETRARHILRTQPKFDLISLPDVVELTAKTLLQTASKSEIYKAANNHFDEMRRVLNVIADRGLQKEN